MFLILASMLAVFNQAQTPQDNLCTTGGYFKGLQCPNGWEKQSSRHVTDFSYEMHSYQKGNEPNLKADFLIKCTNKKQRITGYFLDACPDRWIEDDPNTHIMTWCEQACEHTPSSTTEEDLAFYPTPSA